jgi:hypothetical protein
LQFVCQAALMIERFSSLRFPLRVATFASSLAMIALLSHKPMRAHPICRMALVFLAVMVTGVLHPDTNMLSGIAHWILSVSIWAPLFWVGRLSLSARSCWTAMMLMWGFHVAGSVMGVLQTYYPERFAPSAEFIKQTLGSAIDTTWITLADGRRIQRPFGLSDTPGGAASSGMFAVVLGLVLLMSSAKTIVRLVALAGLLAGMFCIYVCQIRSIMVITLLSAAALVFLQFWQGKLNRVAGLLLIIPAIAAAGVVWSITVGGEETVARMRTLAEASPTSVYYKNRGHFLEVSVTEEVPMYPIGGGLGRYGMMYTYFGDKRLRPFHAELQFVAWVYDGGLLLALLGYGAVIGACWVTLRLAMQRNVDPLANECALIVTALNVGMVAVTFNYPLFNSQGGLMFWLLNALVFASTQTSPPPLVSGVRSSPTATRATLDRAKKVGNR